ncbi:hypothetical protein DVK02_15025 [Halobellus sp. Atlit-31R]|nr:hypothetical protein DVK02_15025 [Halobellus sp. Atlit-31R]
MNARENVAFLTGSEVRIEVLRALRSGVARPTELAEECSCARETAQRAVTAFVERGWAEKVSTSDGYRLTRAGELVGRNYDEFEQCMAVATRFEHLLSNLGGAASDLTCDTLTKTTYAQATAENPHAPIGRFLTVVGEDPIDQFRGVTPIVSGIFNQAADRVIEPESDVQLVVDREVLTTSASEYPEALDRAEDLDGLTLYVSESPLEFGLLLVDGHAYLGAYDDHGNLVASADGTSDPFVEWAVQSFRRIRANASEWN